MQHLIPLLCQPEITITAIMLMEFEWDAPNGESLGGLRAKY